MSRLELRRLVFYITGAIIFLIVCMSGCIRVIGDIEYSVWMAMTKLPENVRKLCTIEDAFNAGMTERLGMLLPLVVSVPAAVETMDDIRSGFCSYEASRMGRRRYAYSKFMSCIKHTIITILAGLGLFITVICIVFPLNPDYSAFTSADIEEITIFQLVSLFVIKAVNIFLYSVAVSLTATLLVFIYPNLYFDFSIIFFVSYLCRDYFIEHNVVCIIVIIVVLFFLYGIIWKRKSEKI